jgi:hypothetical protein
MSETLNIPIQTDTYKPVISERTTISKITLTITGLGIDLLTSDVYMQVKDGSRVLIDVTNGSGITINSSTVLEIDQVEAADNPFKAGSYGGDFLIKDNVNKVDKFFNVKYNIEKTTTRI